MRTSLRLKSALLAMVMCLTAACGSSDKLDNSSSDDSVVSSDKVVVARALRDNQGNHTGKIEIALMSKEDAQDPSKIESNFERGIKKSISELVVEEDSSSNQCYGCRSTYMNTRFDSIYGSEFGRCGSSYGCFWFPGKYALRFAGRLVGGVLRGAGNIVEGTLNGVGNTMDYIWNGPSAIYSNYGVWNNAFVSTRPQGCASFECSRFWRPVAYVDSCTTCYAQPFVSGNYGYTVYEETNYEHIKSVNMPGYSEYLNESSHTVNTSSNTQIW